MDLKPSIVSSLMVSPIGQRSLFLNIEISVLLVSSTKLSRLWSDSSESWDESGRPRERLRGGFFTTLFLEEHIVRGAGIKRRVEVNQVNACLGDVFAQNFQVIAEVKLVLAVHVGRRITQRVPMAPSKNRFFAEFTLK